MAEPVLKEMLNLRPRNAQELSGILLGLANLGTCIRSVLSTCSVGHSCGKWLALWQQLQGSMLEYIS